MKPAPKLKMTAKEYREYIAGKAGQIKNGNPEGAKKKQKGLSYKQALLLKEFENYLKSKYGEVITEYQFHPDRKWRIDYYIPSITTGVEIEGGIWSGGRHTNPVGYQGDMEKYNAIAEAGIKLLRYTYTQLAKLSYQLYL